MELGLSSPEKFSAAIAWFTCKDNINTLLKENQSIFLKII